MSPTIPPTSTPRPPPPTEIPTVPAATERVITGADDNQTVAVDVGSVLLLSLDAGFDWSNFEVSDPAVLQPYALATPRAGAQPVYNAVRQGEATISATGTVHCAPDTPCPAIARLFRANILVRA